MASLFQECGLAGCAFLPALPAVLGGSARAHDAPLPPQCAQS